MSNGLTDFPGGQEGWLACWLKQAGRRHTSAHTVSLILLLCGIDQTAGGNQLIPRRDLRGKPGSVAFRHNLRLQEGAGWCKG